MILPRLKATLVTGLLWALISVPIAVIPIIFSHYRSRNGLRIRLWDMMWGPALAAAAQGLYSRVAFAVMLMVAERGRTLSELPSAHCSLGSHRRDDCTRSSAPGR
jgi:hypothetical protein